MKTETANEHIEITPGVCGGKPRVTGHRITVANIVIWHERLGRSADEIATEYDLTLADVYAALAYYFDNREVIDELHREEQGSGCQLAEEERLPTRREAYRNQPATARIQFYTDEQVAGAEVRGAFVGAAWMSDYETAGTR